MTDGARRAFDRAAWHEDAARAAGRPTADAFAHAELYLMWLRRRDLLASAAPPADRPTELHADAMSAEGRAFTDAYYGRYLDDYGVVFADAGAYAVSPDDEAFEAIARVIDRRYAEWVYAGRPELPPEDEPAQELARLLDDAQVPPELTEAAVLGMSPGQVIEALTQLLERGRSSR